MTDISFDYRYLAGGLDKTFPRRTQDRSLHKVYPCAEIYIKGHINRKILTQWVWVLGNH